jgi:hypothetical protein
VGVRKRRERRRRRRNRRRGRRRRRRRSRCRRKGSQRRRQGTTRSHNRTRTRQPNNDATGGQEVDVATTAVIKLGGAPRVSRGTWRPVASEACGGAWSVRLTDCIEVVIV